MKKKKGENKNENYESKKVREKKRVFKVETKD